MTLSTPEWDEERLARLSFCCFPGFGSRSLRKIAEAFPSFADAWSASVRKFANAGITESSATKFISWRSSFEPGKYVEMLSPQDIHVVFSNEGIYPDTLRLSSDPPEILFYRGKIPRAPAVAVVGTRRMTSYGKQCTERLVEDLAAYGFCIVSGLALGIDAVAHETALVAHAPTIAFLGCGCDDAMMETTPNAKLAKRIWDEGGAVASEFPPGTPPLKQHFPMRNRLIASLAAATVVVEAAEKSGSLITAKLALEENREVLAVPGPIWSAQSKGTNMLLKLGAKVCTDARDVLNALALDRPDLVTQARSELPLNPDEERLSLLLDEPRHVDELARLSGMQSGPVSSLLSVLELKGLAKKIGGQMWTRGRTVA